MQLSSGSLPPAAEHIKSGQLRCLAVTGDARLAELPNVPSMAEAGYPGVDVHLWSGIFAPAATPAPIVAKLEKALDDSIRDPDVSAKFKNLAVTPGGGPAEDFRRIIDAEIIKFQDVVKAAERMQEPMHEAVRIAEADVR